MSGTRNARGHWPILTYTRITFLEALNTNPDTWHNRVQIGKHSGLTKTQMYNCAIGLVRLQWVEKKSSYNSAVAPVLYKITEQGQAAIQAGNRGDKGEDARQ